MVKLRHEILLRRKSCSVLFKKKKVQKKYVDENIWRKDSDTNSSTAPSFAKSSVDNLFHHLLKS